MGFVIRKWPGGEFKGCISGTTLNDAQYHILIGGGKILAVAGEEDGSLYVRATIPSKDGQITISLQQAEGRADLKDL